METLPYSVRSWHPAIERPAKADLELAKDYKHLAHALNKARALAAHGRRVAVFHRTPTELGFKLTPVEVFHPAAESRQVLGTVLRKSLAQAATPASGMAQQD